MVSPPWDYDCGHASAFSWPSCCSELESAGSWQWLVPFLSLTMRLCITLPLHSLNPVVFSVTVYCHLDVLLYRFIRGLSIYLFSVWQCGHEVFGQLLGLKVVAGVGHPLFGFFGTSLGYPTLLLCLPLLLILTLPPFSCYLTLFRNVCKIRSCGWFILSISWEDALWKRKQLCLVSSHHSPAWLASPKKLLGRN